MIKIIHVSDLHIGKTAAQTKRAKDLLDCVHARYFTDSDSCYLLVTGDIIDDGRYTQYQVAEQYLAPFKDRIFLCLGNHDIARDGTFEVVPGALSEYHAMCFRLGAPTESASRDPVVTELGHGSDSVLLVGLNSTKPEGIVVTHALGRIGDSQREKLASAIETHELAPKIVYLHHRPERCHGLDGALGRSLLDRSEFLDIVVDNVQLVAFGHDCHPFVPSEGEQLPQVGERTQFSNMDNCATDEHSPFWSEISVCDGKLSAVYRVAAEA